MKNKELVKIIKEFKNKNYNSFDKFYNETSRGLYIYVFNALKNRERTEEVLEETYKHFVYTVDHCHKNKYFLSHLLRITKTVVVELYNKEKQRINDKDVVNTIKEDENKEDIFYILDYLEKPEKQIVVLHHINKMKFRELSDFLDMSIVKVRKTYRRALKHLKVEVGK